MASAGIIKSDYSIIDKDIEKFPSQTNTEEEAMRNKDADYLSESLQSTTYAMASGGIPTSDEPPLWKDIEKLPSRTNTEEEASWDNWDSNTNARKICRTFGDPWMFLCGLVWLISIIVLIFTRSFGTFFWVVISYALMMDTWFSGYCLGILNSDRDDESPIRWGAVNLYLYHLVSSVPLLILGALLQQGWEIF